jgi:hypothetical protein
MTPPYSSFQRKKRKKRRWSENKVHAKEHVGKIK